MAIANERASISAISLKARSDQASASTRPIKLMLKIGSIHTERVDARQLICINQMSDVSLRLLSYT